MKNKKTNHLLSLISIGAISIVAITLFISIVLFAFGIGGINELTSEYVYSDTLGGWLAIFSGLIMILGGLTAIVLIAVLMLTFAYLMIVTIIHIVSMNVTNETSYKVVVTVQSLLYLLYVIIGITSAISMGWSIISIVVGISSITVAICTVMCLLNTYLKGQKRNE